MAAAAIGVLQLGVAISLAALIFSGPLNEGTGRAAAGFVLGTAIVSAIVGYASSMKVVIAGAQDTGAIMIMAAAVAVAASPDVAPDELVPTVFVLIAIATVGTGLVFFVLGHYGLTSFVRFLPFPVISGFTAGTGWLLFRGGIEVMHGGAVHLGDVSDLFSWSQAKFLLPGLLLVATMLVIVSTKLTNTLVSVAILGGTVLFHLIGRNVSSIDELEAQGWLVGPFAEGAGWAPIGPSDVQATNWSVLFENGLLIAAAIAVSVIGLLLNLSGLEGGPDRQINMNAEMKSAGVANVLGGFGSGLIGYHLLGDITLGRQLGARGRVVPISIAVMALATFVIGSDLIGMVPRAVAGGVLAGLGVNLLVDWAKNSLMRMHRTDRILSSLILLTIATFGVLAGVGAGVVVAATLFIVNYSRIDPVRHVIDASGHSNVDRDEREQAILGGSGGAILVFELQGFLFFGSTTRLQSQIDTEAVTDSNGAATQYVILDFVHVTGIDSTAATGLATMAENLGHQGITTIWSGVSPALEDELRRDIDLTERHRDLDHAIAFCEDQLVNSVEVDAFFLHRPAPSLFDGPIMETINLPQLSLAAGDTLIKAGATDCDVYFVESGKLTAWIQADDGRLIRIRQVLPGAVLGEIAFCTGAPRTAWVIADTDCVIRALPRDRFDEIVEADPQVAIAIQGELLRRLGNRVSSTSAMVRDLLR